jgi:hypothetical protein
MSSIYLYILQISAKTSKRQKLLVFGVKRGIQGMGIYQTLGRQLGTLVPRPQTPGQFGGISSLAYLWVQA